jgi:beta-xylosidase
MGKTIKQTRSKSIYNKKYFRRLETIVKMKKYFLYLLILFFVQTTFAQKNKVYTNPIIPLDYSDPDVVRVGEDYYLTASSFNAVPGLPILHSTDLVHWKIVNYALQKLIPEKHFDTVQHGGGVWAPSIRYHNNEFYIFYPDPDFGIYVIKAKKVTDKWSEPILIEAGKGLIDPCVYWDSDGKVYMVHAYAGSRAGIKSILNIKELDATATKVIGNNVMVYDGHTIDPTIEGPKLYKRNNYYYIFAPAGGVSTGWQTVLRSKNIYGPYERKVILEQGKTAINGPHQGAWINTSKNEDWFIHFQDKDMYGRIVHLQPMQWQNDWPIIGIDNDGNGIGEPVSSFKNPIAKNIFKDASLIVTDNFSGTSLSLNWQWQANPKNNWAFTTASNFLRMPAVFTPDSVVNIWKLPNILMQKIPAENVNTTINFKFYPNTENERFGFVLLGTDYAGIFIVKQKDSLAIVYTSCTNADKGNLPTETVIEKTSINEIAFRIEMEENGNCTFLYSIGNKQAKEIPQKFTAKPGKWVGAKIGMYCTRNKITNDAGFANVLNFTMQTD